MTPIGQTVAIQASLGHENRDEYQNVAQQKELRVLSQKLEATFLAEMLKYAGVGESKSEFSGGIGEEQFASFLRQAHADEMVKAGGIGLAEQLFQSLMETHHGQD